MICLTNSKKDRIRLTASWFYNQFLVDNIGLPLPRKDGQVQWPKEIIYENEVYDLIVSETIEFKSKADYSLRC